MIRIRGRLQALDCSLAHQEESLALSRADILFLFLQYNLPDSAEIEAKQRSV